MRGAVASVGLMAMVLVTWSCASSKSPGTAAASGPVVAASSHAGGSASSIPVSSAPGCPSVAGRSSGPSSSGPDGQLFVAGSPTLTTLCQSVPFTADGGSPAAPVLVQITGPVLAKLIASLNALVPTNDVLPCPAPSQADVITFGGSTLASSAVWINVDGGCNFVWSDTGVHAYASNALLKQIAAILIGAPASGSPAPTITVTPATDLIDGQTVQVTVAGLHPEDKVWLSECATAADVNPFGCGTGLPEMPFLITDATGHASGAFTVTADIPTAAEDGTTQPCSTCVLAAVSGDAAGSPPAPTASAPLTFAPTSAPASPTQATAPPVGSHVAATPEHGVTVTCPDIVHGDPGAIGLAADSSAQPPSQSTVFRAVVRCALVTRTYAGLGTWQVELAEVAYGNPTALITQLRAASQPPDGACGMGSQYGYPWFVLIESNGHIDRPAVPTQGCFPSPSAVAALNELPFKVVDAARVWPEPKT